MRGLIRPSHEAWRWELAEEARLDASWSREPRIGKADEADEE